MNKLLLKIVWGWIAIVSLLTSTSGIVISQTPPDLPPQTGGRSGGSRGCDTEQAIAANKLPALMLLTPKVAKTAATRPTFAWFIRDAAPRPLRFRLYQYESARVRLIMELHDDRLLSQPGIMVLSLPNPALSVGRYLWQVELECDRNHPSSNIFAEADIEVVATEPALQMKLAKANSVSDRMSLYAEAGLWHDALRLVLVNDRLLQVQKSAIDNRTVLLLRQIGITDLELKSLQMSPIHRIGL